MIRDPILLASFELKNEAIREHLTDIERRVLVFGVTPELYDEAVRVRDEAKQLLREMDAASLAADSAWMDEQCKSL